MTKDSLALKKIVWLQPDGKRVTCDEKLKVLTENLEEIRQACQDALEDAVLMGCDEKQVREVLDAVVTSVENPYKK
jgi:regulator of replication initiation timing